MTASKKTSQDVAQLASAKLKNSEASKVQKTLAGSALAQSSTEKKPSKEIETLAAKVLGSAKYNEDTKTLAASVLAQADSSN